MANKKARKDRDDGVFFKYGCCQKMNIRSIEVAAQCDIIISFQINVKFSLLLVLFCKT